MPLLPMSIMGATWWSRKYGYLDVKQCASHKLDVYVGSNSTHPLGSIMINGKSEERVIKFRIANIVVYLHQTLSTPVRLVWTDNSDVVVDYWDRKLLQEINEAAGWILNQQIDGLSSEVQLGLDRMASGEVTASAQTVALCMASKNRLWQLERALPLNLLHAWPHRNWVTIHLVVCDDNVTLHWVMQNCWPAISIGLLRLYTTCGDMPYWHASIGKNTSHMVASEDILVNVDGDNLIGVNFPEHVVQMFASGYKVVQYEYGEGTCGRIAYLRDDFLQIRGYDEKAFPMGAQDTDIVLRIKMLYKGQQLAYKKAKLPQFSQAIPNDKKAKVRNCDPVYNKMTWGQMDVKNRATFKSRRDNGLIQRNQGKEHIGVFAKHIDVDL